MEQLVGVSWNEGNCPLFLVPLSPTSSVYGRNLPQVHLHSGGKLFQRVFWCVSGHQWWLKVAEYSSYHTFYIPSLLQLHVLLANWSARAVVVTRGILIVHFKLYKCIQVIRVSSDGSIRHWREGREHVPLNPSLRHWAVQAVKSTSSTFSGRHLKVWWSILWLLTIWLYSCVITYSLPPPLLPPSPSFPVFPSFLFFTKLCSSSLKDTSQHPPNSPCSHQARCSGVLLF